MNSALRRHLNFLVLEKLKGIILLLLYQYLFYKNFQVKLFGTESNLIGHILEDNHGIHCCRNWNKS